MRYVTLLNHSELYLCKEWLWQMTDGEDKCKWYPSGLDTT